MVAAKPYNYDLLSEWVVYDETSPTLLRWKKSNKSGFVQKGQPCGNRDGRGYWRFQLKNRTYKLHRVVYILVHGYDPAPLFIDHIDRNKDNNHHSNLRTATYSENNKNKKLTRQFAYCYKNRPSWRGQYVHPKTRKAVHVCSTRTEFEAQCLAMAHLLENYWLV